MAKTSSETAQAVKAPFLKAYHELFDSDDLWAAARKLGVVTRERKVDVPALVEAAVLAMSGLPGTQTTIFANYLQLMGEAIAPSSFYGRFTVPFAGLMADVSGRAIEAVRAVAPEDRENEEVAALLRHFTDVQITDSTCKLLQKLAQDWAPSTSPERPASFKLHAVISLKDRLPLEQHLSPQRHHDSPELDESAISKGALFLGDLGYIDQERLVRLKRRDVHVVMRLKKSQDPCIHRIRVGKGSKSACRGESLDKALGMGMLDFDKGRLDVDVVITTSVDGQPTREIFRVVGIAGDQPGEDWYYLTTVPPEILSVDDVGLAYTLRWGT